MNARRWLWLALIQSVWAGSYVAMKTAGNELSVAAVVFLRYGIAAVCFLTYWVVTVRPRFAFKDLLLLAGIGTLDFALAPMLQIGSLRFTQAIDVSIVIVFEPLLTVLAAAVLLRERPSRRTWVALLVATAGMLVLSSGTAGHSTDLDRTRLLGNLMFLASLVCEAMVSVASRVFTQRYAPGTVIGAMMVAGFLSGSAINAPVLVQTDFTAISLGAWAAILFLALGCSVFAYVVWARTFRDVPVNLVVLSLFIQPIVGSILGALLLGESLGLATFAGAALICASLVWWQLGDTRAIGGHPTEP